VWTLFILVLDYYGIMLLIRAGEEHQVFDMEALLKVIADGGSS